MTDFSGVLTALDRAGQLVKAPEKPPSSLTGVVDHTSDVTPGVLFCAVKGTTSDGHDYLPQARQRGAAAVLVTDPQGMSDEIVVRNGRMATAVAAAAFHGHPADELVIIGVTGTNGKSTTVHLIRHLLNSDGNVGVIGTLGAFDGTGSALYEEKLTTPGSAGLHQTLATFVARGTRAVVMEASSHALDQQRLFGVRLCAAVFTNVTRDHLDYHKTFAAYVAAKMSLVEQVTVGGWQIVNADVAVWKTLPLGKGQRRCRYGTRGSPDARGVVRAVTKSGSQFTLRYAIPGEDTAARSLELQTPLLGAFNVSNALSAATTALALGLPAELLTRRLADAPQVPGRMEQIGTDDFLILRDYAHTPDALQRAIDAARPITDGRLIVLFGCGGDRDPGKRAPMGRIAVRHADIAVLTSDNPRTEDPEKILRDVEEGMNGHAYLRIVDRKDAIHRAVGMMQPGDCLLLAGKGHETYQVLGTRRVPFDECEIVAEAIRHRTHR